MPQSIVLSCKKLNVNTKVPSIDRFGLHAFANDSVQHESVSQLFI